MSRSLVVRRERRSDAPAVSQLLAAAFRENANGNSPAPEVGLVDALRDDPGWLAALSFVAELDGELAGTCVSTAATIDGRTGLVVGLGPLAVHPDAQRRGVGTCLVQASVAAADALGLAAVVLLGSVGYYGRQGFVAADELGIRSPEPRWGRNFQVRPLAAWEPTMAGAFEYAEPFSRL